MSSSDLVLVAAVFIASAVEMVEALTIVLAVGFTRGWRSSLEGAGTALVILTVIVIALGPALVHYVPINLLRSVVGGVLLIFGLQWMRKAVLRACGFKDKRDEDAVYRKAVKELSGLKSSDGRDAQGFAVAFKGVFIEGLEVVIIVLTLGSSAHNLGLASLAAISAVLVVASIGLAVSRQLSGVPENAMKLVVGVMLVSFGTFWGGEGLGLNWPGNDLMIPILVALYAIITFVMVRMLTRMHRERQPLDLPIVQGTQDKVQLAEHLEPLTQKSLLERLIRGFLRFWWDFLVGETPEIFVGTLVIFIVTELLLHAQVPSIVVVVAGPLLVITLLNATVARSYRAEL